MTDQPRSPDAAPLGPRAAAAAPPPRNPSTAPAAGGAPADPRFYTPVRNPRPGWPRRPWWAPAPPGSGGPLPRPEPVAVERPTRRGSTTRPVVFASVLSA